MNRNQVVEKLQEIFDCVLSMEGQKIFDEMTAEDVSDWDSFKHVNLIMKIEKDFKIKFHLGELHDLKNVGTLIEKIMSKTTAHGPQASL